MRSQAKIAGSSEYLTPLNEFFLFTTAWKMHNRNLQPRDYHNAEREA
jgi:hypothetical protein